MIIWDIGWPHESNYIEKIECANGLIWVIYVSMVMLEIGVLMLSKLYLKWLEYKNHPYI